ncbi:MAG TPA: hypothetical protein VFF52_14095 [Isosphaeraceae bacterium]|nr:hypothetical protein [Isosphaeraceae bacterium]
MSLITMGPLTAAAPPLPASNPGGAADNDVVEISLLLPARWAQDLMTLSRERGQSIGQILRGMIGQALHDGITPP